MRLPALALLAASLSLLAATNAMAAVNITFDNPVNFSDVPRNAVDRERVLDELRTHLQELAKRLPPGTDLKLDIKDVNLAGRLEPHGQFQQEIRVIRDIGDAPRMDIAYAVSRNGQQVAQGEDHVIDMNYMVNTNRYDAGDTLRYEKKMLDDWFASRFLNGTNGRNSQGR